MNRIKALVIVIALLTVAITPTFAQDDAFSQSFTIADIVVAADDFSILEAAVVEAGLVGVLSSGEFTVFAPTNGAFETLLRDLGITAEQLLADKALLTKVLTYHVIPGEVKAADVVASIPFSATTVQGEAIAIALDPSGRVGLNNGQATVSGVDLDVSNGVIHIIDNVILPPSITG